MNEWSVLCLCLCLCSFVSGHRLIDYHRWRTHLGLEEMLPVTTPTPKWASLETASGKWVSRVCFWLACGNESHVCVCVFLTCLHSPSASSTETGFITLQDGPIAHVSYSYHASAPVLPKPPISLLHECSWLDSLVPMGDHVCVCVCVCEAIYSLCSYIGIANPGRRHNTQLYSNKFHPC